VAAHAQSAGKGKGNAGNSASKTTPNGSTPTGSTPTGSTTGSAAPSTPTTRTQTWNACGGHTVTSLMCASVQVAVTGTTTVVRVRNLSGDPTLAHDGAASSGQWILTAIGFEGIPAAAGTFTTATGATSGPWWQRTTASAAPGGWARFDDKQFGGGVNLDFGIDNGAGISGGIASSCASLGSLPGGSNRFWMTPVDGCANYTIASRALNDGWFEASFVTVESWNPNGGDVSVFFKGQNGPGGGSYECLVGGAQKRGDCSDAQFPDDPASPGGLDPMSPVPEPRTFFLVGTGVVAVLAVRHRRRRLP
jgi:hypothetical protein